MRAFGLGPTQLARAAERLTRAVNELPGLLFRTGGLFPLEPAPAGGPRRVADGGGGPVPLSSGRGRLTRVWRIFVSEETGDSSEESFERLYTEYGVLLRQIAIRRYRIPPDDAEALVHETFLGYLQRHTYVTNVKGYLYATVTHRCVDYWRARKHEAPLLPEHDETADARQAAPQETIERDLTVAAVLARLGEKCRETLHGYFFMGEEKNALADRLATTPGYIDQLISTCRRRARELYRSMTSRRP